MKTNMKIKRLTTENIKKIKGFTLIELIVVIAIIGVLAAILIPTLFGRVKEARQKTANDSAAKLAEQAAIIAADMEAKGTTLSFQNAYYIADASSTDVYKMGEAASDEDINSEYYFKHEMEQALPNLVGVPWAVSFDSNSSVNRAIYWEKGSSYVGTYPDTLEIQEQWKKTGISKNTTFNNYSVLLEGMFSTWDNAPMFNKT